MGFAGAEVNWPEGLKPKRKKRRKKAKRKAEPQPVPTVTRPAPLCWKCDQPALPERSVCAECAERFETLARKHKHRGR